MNRIKSISRSFRILFQVVLVVFPLFVFAFWMNFPLIGIDSKLTVTFLPSTGEVLYQWHMLTLADLFAELSVSDRIAGAVINLIPTGLTMLIFYLLIKLFRLYEQGIIFTINNVRYVKYIGITMLIKELIHPLYEALVTYVLTMNNPATDPYFQMNWTQLNMTFIVVALVIILISWIMAEGCKLQEEQSYTV